jgi:hypothetical protein
MPCNRGAFFLEINTGNSSAINKKALIFQGFFYK